MSALFTSVIGVAGYMANFIQFGLDQLLEAPSEYLGLFVHWAKWIYDGTSKLVYIYLFVYVCHSDTLHSRMVMLTVFYSFPAIGLFMLLVLVMVTICKRHWFYAEPGQCNPYKIVLKVLIYAGKHKYPLQHSAFTYGDNVKPSRLDFCKQN